MLLASAAAWFLELSSSVSSSISISSMKRFSCVDFAENSLKCTHLLDATIFALLSFEVKAEIWLTPITNNNAARTNRNLFGKSELRCCNVFILTAFVVFLFE